MHTCINKGMLSLRDPLSMPPNLKNFAFSMVSLEIINIHENEESSRNWFTVSKRCKADRWCLTMHIYS